MRALFWVVAIAALAAGVVAAARYNTGYALFVLLPYRLEISLNLLFALAVAGFAVGYLAVRATSATLRLPRQVQEYRAARRRDQAHAALIETVREFFAGRYARAEKAAGRCIALGEHAGLAAAFAARAAHELRAFERRDDYLLQAAKLASDDDAVRIVTAAELLLEQRRVQEALAVLGALPRKHTAALRLELKAQQLARNWEQVLALVDQLEKRGVYDAEHAEQIRRYAQAERIERQGADPHALDDIWQRIPQRQRRDPRVAAAAARSFIACGNSGQAQRIIEDSLDAAWDSELVALYAECAEGAVSAIERAESWLTQHPGDAALLLTLGRLCAQQALWGKAQSYLEASLSLEPGYPAHLSLAQLHERLGNADAAQRHYRQSLERAVAELRQDAAAGYRRMSI
jgi:HemY protein